MPKHSLQVTTTLRHLAVLLLCALLGAGQAGAGSMSLLGVGRVAAAVTFQGIGDVVSGASFFGSCARAYNAAYANGTNSLCDLVDSAAPSTPICTLRVLTTGFVDLAGTYCTGSVTPATKCAAATGAVCNVSKIYDQTGNGNHFTNTTAATQPVLSFSAINGLPATKYVSASGTLLTSTTTFTLTVPWVGGGVLERTSGTALGTLLGANTSSMAFGVFSSANQANQNGSSAGASTQTDGAFHAYISNQLSGSAVLTVDGADTTVSTGQTISALALRYGRGSGGATPDGLIMEAWVYPSSTTLSAGQKTSLNSNIHGTNGYNF